MSRGLLYQENYKPQFSGHETFPLRYGWLKKLYDRVVETRDEPSNRQLCWGDDAIARFGVGKNMVGSMRHWAKATDIIKEGDQNSVRPTELGDLLFGLDAVDPYLEHAASLWLLHWKLASQPERTTWYWAFSHYPTTRFSREDFMKRLKRLAEDRGWGRASNATLKNDIACFVRTYVAQPPSVRRSIEDSLESPLTELGLIKPTARSDGFRFVRGPKQSLGNGVFAYALAEYWKETSNAASMSFEAIAQAPGSPGRVFLLEENDVVDQLVELGRITNGFMQWSETAGLKQVIRSGDWEEQSTLMFAKSDYQASARQVKVA